ncbi:hypothetical protein K437DRAFT_11846 [Tilletiaria anomala UBC 951]|uniref:Uncharacterized protein n=1 Tax=Tilletiaria anomala (strain ATCC 24038 / CBS 436.72 / UBC 951) TaxID=1037660 RepID=A0A066VKW8_TILAU|nr:uncharacterized protein K437DRAFT_11846 [Tilletiaria anomala UBC 951]KDN39394.1 hypothetical protein K437DRAFT_11846 [Tilletiaria anomala UBC 951]
MSSDEDERMFTLARRGGRRCRRPGFKARLFAYGSMDACPRTSKCRERISLQSHPLDDRDGHARRCEEVHKPQQMDGETTMTGRLFPRGARRRAWGDDRDCIETRWRWDGRDTHTSVAGSPGLCAGAAQSPTNALDESLTHVPPPPHALNSQCPPKPPISILIFSTVCTVIGSPPPAASHRLTSCQIPLPPCRRIHATSSSVPAFLSVSKRLHWASKMLKREKRDTQVTAHICTCSILR